MQELKYGFSVDLPGSTFSDAVALVSQALKAEGFGVLVDIDLQATFKQKLQVDGPRYRILGACNPTLAHQAIELDSDIGLLLPCNIVVRETDTGDIHVAAVSPRALFDLVDNDDLRDVSKNVEMRLRRALASLVASDPGVA